MAAFENAVSLGYTYLETDVRVTSDGVALAFHDASLDRVTEHRGRIAQLPWATVRHARIGGLEPIPLLADVLASWPLARINIDVKATSGVGPTIDAIRRTATKDRVCVGAFSGARIDDVRRAFGEALCTSLGPREALALRLAPARRSAGTRLNRHRNRCAQVPVHVGRMTFLDARFIARAHAAQMPVHVWTVNDRTEMVRLLDIGVDGIMTDAADVLRDVLTQRGQWRRTGPA